MADHEFAYARQLHKVKIDTPDGEVECVAASYAGVSFFVEESASSGGREVVTTSLPFSEKHVNEDLGKKVLNITCNIYLLGVDCEVKREKLESVLNKGGAFEFIHPHYGKMNARCVAYSLNFKKSESEFISGEATFVPEQNIKGQTRSVEDLRGLTIEKSNSVLDSAKSKFSAAFSIAGKAKSVVDSVADYTDKTLDSIENSRNTIRSVAGFVDTISKIRENVSLIMSSPSDFASRLQDLLTMTKETFSFGESNEYVNESLVIMNSTVSQRRVSAFAAADELDDDIDLLVLMSSAAMAARSIVDCDFKSAEEAGEMQDNVSNAFDAVLGAVDSVDDYANLVDMEAVALKYLRNEMARLAYIVELPLLTTRDALSVCFDCYGNLDKFDDIVARNDIGDPLVITPRKLRVLSK